MKKQFLGQRNKKISIDWQDKLQKTGDLKKNYNHLLCLKVTKSKKIFIDLDISKI